MLESVVKGVSITLLVFLALLLIGIFFAVIVTVLWNWLMPNIFGLPTIDYWQGYGLWLLSSLLLKSSTYSASK